MGMLETVGDAGDWDTTAQAESAVDPDGVVEYIDTTFFGIFNVHDVITFGVSGLSVARTYRASSRILIRKYNNSAPLFTLNGSGNLTVEKLNVIAMIGRILLPSANGTGQMRFKSCNFKTHNDTVVRYNNASTTFDIGYEGCVFFGQGTPPWTHTSHSDGQVGFAKNCSFISTGSPTVTNNRTTLGVGSSMTFTNCLILGFSVSDILDNNNLYTFNSCISEDGTHGTTAKTIEEMALFDPLGTNTQWGLCDPTPASNSQLLNAGVSQSITDLYGNTVTTSDVGAVAYTQAASPGAPDGLKYQGTGDDNYEVRVDSLNSGERMQVVVDIGGSDNFLFLKDQLVGDKFRRNGFTENEEIAQMNPIGGENQDFNAAGVSNIRAKIVNQYGKVGTLTAATNVGLLTQAEADAWEDGRNTNPGEANVVDGVQWLLKGETKEGTKEQGLENPPTPEPISITVGPPTPKVVT